MIVSINGLDLNVEIEGEGSPLLLLHGFTGSWRTWKPFIPLWSKHHQLIMVDIIGHGASASPEELEHYYMDLAVQDLTEILNQLKIEKAHLLGYSLGGRLALTLALQQPNRIQSLILESSSPGLATAEERRERMIRDEALAKRIELEGLDHFVQYWENIPLFTTQKRLPVEVQQNIRNQRLKNNIMGLANSLRGMGTGAQESNWGKLGDLLLPVLLLVGDQDQKFSQIGQRMRKLFPAAKLTTLSNAGHATHVEQPEIFGKLVLDYLNMIDQK